MGSPAGGANSRRQANSVEGPTLMARSVLQQNSPPKQTRRPVPHALPRGEAEMAALKRALGDARRAVGLRAEAAGALLGISPKALQERETARGRPPCVGLLVRAA